MEYNYFLQKRYKLAFLRKILNHIKYNFKKENSLERNRNIQEQALNFEFNSFLL